MNTCTAIVTDSSRTELSKNCTGLCVSALRATKNGNEKRKKEQAVTNELYINICRGN